MNIRLFTLTIILCLSVLCTHAQKRYGGVIILKGVTLIDGTGAAPMDNMYLVIQADTIVSVLPANTRQLPAHDTVFDLSGKTIMPEIINAHGHLGITKDTGMGERYYTKGNIIRQLQVYQAYGVGAVLCLGTDKDIIFQLREQLQNGKLPGAEIFTAGYGFGVPGGAPPPGMSDKIYRPAKPEEARQDVKALAALKPDMVKIWVDDFEGKYPEMKPEIYEAVIQEAHKQHLRVAAHVYHLKDAIHLINAGVDVLAHSIRDGAIDDNMIDLMKKKGVTYIPTLTLDFYNLEYTRSPKWLNDPFFNAGIDENLFNQLNSEAYHSKIKGEISKNKDALRYALPNLKKVYRSGIKVALGTDSGAQPVRIQGFSEHMELELMVRAGLTPLEAITCATKNGAELLHATKLGTLQPGKKADFIILNANPAKDIRNTRTILSVWKDGHEVSRGPLADRKVFKNRHRMMRTQQQNGLPALKKTQAVNSPQLKAK